MCNTAMEAEVNPKLNLKIVAFLVISNLTFWFYMLFAPDRTLWGALLYSMVVLIVCTLSFVIEDRVKLIGNFDKPGILPALSLVIFLVTVIIFLATPFVRTVATSPTDTEAISKNVPRIMIFCGILDLGAARLLQVHRLCDGQACSQACCLNGKSLVGNDEAFYFAYIYLIT
ncbi:MAG: hypothetical protein JWN90_587 [Parcubacteria group bacterium]|nr:hypothetical protein [Parcubacteria group bacterium]